MILGVGTDIIDIRRIERSIERFGDRFRNLVVGDGAGILNPEINAAQNYAFGAIDDALGNVPSAVLGPVSEALSGAQLVATGLWSPDGIFVWMRFLFGIVGPASLMGFIWKTVEIRSTQSATGILYVQLFLVLSGELRHGATVLLRGEGQEVILEPRPTAEAAE